MFIDTRSLAYPLDAAAVIAANPDKSFPIPFELPDGYAPVQATVPPSFDPATHELQEAAPKKVGVKWVQQWAVTPLPAEVLAANAAAAAARLLDDVRTEAQRRLDAFAQERRYDGILSLASYATSKDPVHVSEGQRGVDLRDAVWAVLKSIEVDVLAGRRAMPTFLEALEELPKLTWGDQS